MIDQTPVPWSEVPDDAKWMTLDDDGEVCIWNYSRPVLLNGMWNGNLDEMTRIRWPDGDEHEPKIWERPTDD